MTLFVYFCIPETKGVPIEELNEIIMQKVSDLLCWLPKPGEEVLGDCCRALRGCVPPQCSQI